MPLSLFGCYACMNTLKDMSPNDVAEWAVGLPSNDVHISEADGYLSLESGGFLVLYGRNYRSWEIVKNSPFTNHEVQYLHTLNFFKPDPNPNDHCWQRLQPQLPLN